MPKWLLLPRRWHVFGQELPTGHRLARQVFLPSVRGGTLLHNSNTVDPLTCWKLLPCWLFHLSYVPGGFVLPPRFCCRECVRSWLLLPAGSSYANQVLDWNHVKCRLVIVGRLPPPRSAVALIDQGGGDGGGRFVGDCGGLSRFECKSRQPCM